LALVIEGHSNLQEVTEPRPFAAGTRIVCV